MNVKKLEWKSVKGSQSQIPLEIDDTSSPCTVYLRKNIKKEIEETEEGPVSYYVYDEVSLTKDEYEEYINELNNPGIQSIKEDTLILMEAGADSYENAETNSIILMQAIADLYELIATLQ